MNPKGHIPNLIPITKDTQPSPESKSAGWQRRREAQKILDEFMRIGGMSMQALQDLIADVKKHPDKHTVREVKIAQYLSKEKFVTDWLDRHISKAPQEVDMNIIGVDEIMKKLKSEEDVL